MSWKKRFDKKYEETIEKVIDDCEYWGGHINEGREKNRLKRFIEQEIKKAEERGVKAERRRIMKIANINLRTKNVLWLREALEDS